MSRNCRSAREQISESLDSGNAIPDDVEAHLLDCGPCSEFRQQSVRLGANLSHSPSASHLPAGLHERIMGAVEQEAAQPAAAPKVIAFRKWVTPIAAAAAIVLAAVILWPEGHGGEGDPQSPVVEAPPEVGPSPPADQLEVTVDIAAVTAAVERGVDSVLNEKTELIVADLGRVKDFFGSRFKAMELPSL